MKNLFLQFLIDCFQIVPASVFIWLGLIFILGTAVLLVSLGFKKGIQWSAGLLLMEYLFLLGLLSFGARPIQSERTYNLSLFWSYPVIRAGNLTMSTQVIMNVVSFVPIGFLLGYSFPKMKWWSVMIVGGIISLLIETSQFVFKRGLAEFDDIFHNVLGYMIGYGLFLVIARLTKTISNMRTLALNN